MSVPLRKTTTMIYKMLALERSWADRFQATMRKPRQLFVTQSEELVSQVKAYYDQRNPSLALAPRASGSSVPNGCTSQIAKQVDQRESFLPAHEVSKSASPSRYGALRDEDFPMFLSYNEVSNLSWKNALSAVNEALISFADSSMPSTAISSRKGRPLARRLRYCKTCLE